MKILNVKSELGLFWQHPNCQAFWSVSERVLLIRMTTCFNSIDYRMSSQQKSLYEDICSINLILWLKVIPQIQPERDKARVNSLTYTFWSHKLKLFAFPPFPSLHLLSSNTKQQSNVKVLLVRSIYHHTIKSHVTTTGDRCLVTSYKILFRNLDVLCQSGRCTQNSLFIWHLKCRTHFCTRCAFTNKAFMLLEESTSYL